MQEKAATAPTAVAAAPPASPAPVHLSEAEQKAQTLAKYEADFVDLEDPNEDADEDGASKLTETKHTHK